MDPTVPSVAAVLTVGGASLVTLVLVQAIKSAWKPSDEQKARFLPLVSIIVGVIVVLAGSFALDLVSKVDLFQGVLTGIFAGVSASGLWDLIRSPS